MWSIFHFINFIFQIKFSAKVLHSQYFTHWLLLQIFWIFLVQLWTNLGIKWIIGKEIKKTEKEKGKVLWTKKKQPSRGLLLPIFFFFLSIFFQGRPSHSVPYRPTERDRLPRSSSYTEKQRHDSYFFPSSFPLILATISIQVQYKNCSKFNKESIQRINFSIYCLNCPKSRGELNAIRWHSFFDLSPQVVPRRTERVMSSPSFSSSTFIHAVYPEKICMKRTSRSTTAQRWVHRHNASSPLTYTSIPFNSTLSSPSSISRTYSGVPLFYFAARPTSSLLRPYVPLLRLYVTAVPALCFREESPRLLWFLPWPPLCIHHFINSRNHKDGKHRRY